MNARIVAGGGTVEALIGDSDLNSDRDAALLRALLSGSLRWHHRLEWKLDRLLGDRPRRPQPILAALLRIGLLQLSELRIPDHAAVAATVDAAVELGHAKARGFVNAVLRRYLRERAELDASEDVVVRYSHPQWLFDAIVADWPDRYADVLEANNARAPLWVRVNATRISTEDYLASLASAGMEAARGEAGGAALRVETPCRAVDLPGYREGLVAVQDAAAQLAAGLVAPAPGQRILDACAAPGGKAAHLLELCPGIDELVALDRDHERLGRVATELDRLGLAATLRCADATAAAQWWDGRPFDRILLDAPCSGTGVIRRHPEIKVVRTPRDVTAAAELQARLLDALWPLLAPGGRMVYATCSLLDVENVKQIRCFLDRHPDACCAALGAPTHFRVQPGAADMDGFYYACLDRR